MRICFIVAGMDKRKHLLERCIECYRNSRYADCDIFCYYQGSLFESVKGREIFKAVIVDNKPRGVFTPRYELMKRFAIDYDYTIIIDDDLFILPETDYCKTVKFVQSMKNRVVCTLSNSKVTGIIERDDNVNIEGGMVFPRSAILEIVKYFSDKEQDYTFDYFWLLCYVKGFDLYRDRRSRSNHCPCRKVDGKFTGFNDTMMSKPYIPMMTEYFLPAGVRYNHNRIEPDFTTPKHLTELGKRERIKNKLRMCGEDTL